VLPVSRSIDRFDATFDYDGLIANAGLIVVATLMSRLGLERLANAWVRTGSFAPGRKICTLITAMLAGANTSITSMCCVRVRHSRCCRSE
jgi:hypothetical protein